MNVEEPKQKIEQLKAEIERLQTEIETIEKESAKIELIGEYMLFNIYNFMGKHYIKHVGFSVWLEPDLSGFISVNENEFEVLNKALHKLKWEV